MKAIWGQNQVKVDDTVLEILTIGFVVSGVQWRNDTMVQVWAQIADHDRPNKHESFTCTVQYRRDQEYASDVLVENYFGEESFKFDEVSLTHGYDEINFIDLDRRNPSIKPWQKDFLGLNKLYESGYKSKVSS